MRISLFTLWAILGTCRLLAAEPGSGLKVEVLLENVNHPCGIALRPPGYSELFLAESGAGRVLCVRLNKPPVVTSAIDGFPREEFGDGPRYSLGPLAVEFLDAATLVIGEGGQPDGGDMVRVYQLPGDGKTLRFDQSKHALRPPPVSDQEHARDGDFFAIAQSPLGLFVAANGGAGGDGIFKADAAGLATNRLHRFIDTARDTGGKAPTALAMSKRGELVLGQAGALSADKDSVLCFYHAASGRRLLKLDTGLHDITGLAYAQSGLLYAIDFAWSEPASGGLYRLDMEIRNGRQAVKAVKLMPLDRPAGLVIASARVMYVTTFGDRSASAADHGKMGQLLKIEKLDGDL